MHLRRAEVVDREVHRFVGKADAGGGAGDCRCGVVEQLPASLPEEQAKDGPGAESGAGDDDGDSVRSQRPETVGGCADAAGAERVLVGACCGSFVFAACVHGNWIEARAVMTRAKDAS